MKILYLITKGEIGGAQVHVLDLCIGMKNKGHEVALMCPSGSFLAGEFLKNSSLENKNFYRNDYFANTLNPFKILKACLAISKAIKDFNPDIIACHSSMAGVLGRFVSLFYKKIKIVFTAHSWAFTEGAPFLRKVFMIPVEKFLAIFTDKIICVSVFDKNISLKYKIAKENKIVVIYNGVKNRELRNLAKKEVFKIVTVMRLDYPKLPELLIKAFASIVETHPNAELEIIGYGPRTNKINLLIDELGLKNKVKVFVSLGKEEVASRLTQADLFALASLHEGLPITILEAMSVGLPIVASNVGGIKEEVDESNGYLVENNVEKIKEVILKIISNQDISTSMSKNSWNKQREIFSEEKFIKETEEVYKGLLMF